MSVSEFTQYSVLDNEILIENIQLIQQNVDSKTKASLQRILDFLTQRNLDSYQIILSKLAFGSGLFADNE